MDHRHAAANRISTKSSTAAPPPCAVSLLTPVGRGAIATVAVRGPEAVAHADACFVAAAGRSLTTFSVGRIVVGRWQAAGPPGEDVVICRRAEERLEIHCHGGRVAARTIIDSLVAGGCRELPWRQWVRTECVDPIVAEARIALAAAPTERTAAVLLDQMRGALRRGLETIRQLLENSELDRARRALNRLIGRTEFGLHLIRPWQVVLAGRPNVGKSSLINALLGYQRSIVYEQPGTTRDVLTAQTALDGWPVELVDTAGLRRSGEAIEAAGIQLARDRLATADLVVLVFDASRPGTDEDALLCQQWPCAIAAYNKCDIRKSETANRSAGFLTSALTGEGVERLLSEIVARLVPEPPPPGAAVPFTDHQREILSEALARLDTGRPSDTIKIVGELLPP